MIPPSSQNDIFEWNHEKNKNILNHDDGSLKTRYRSGSFECLFQMNLYFVLQKLDSI